MASAMEFGSIVTGQPIIGLDGRPIAQTRPYPSKRHPRIYWVIGWDVEHIGKTIHKNLFQDGMGGTLYAIKDKATGNWRTYDRTDPGDVAREGESVLAGPIIPPRMIVPDSWVWNQQGGGEKAGCFSSVTLINGARIYAFPSTAMEPAAGDAVSGIFVDEDIRYPGHLAEWQDRLGDEDGWLIWASYPRLRNPALFELTKQAENQEHEIEDPAERTTSVFELHFSKNKFMTDKSKRNRLLVMGSAEEIARRDRGDLLESTLAMYDFDLNLHGVSVMNERMPEQLLTPRDVVQRLAIVGGGRMPSDWTRYLIIDPSNTRTACGCIAVPPIQIGTIPMRRTCVLEWELVVSRYSAQMLADALADRMRLYGFEEFIFDMQMGRATHVGLDTAVYEAYQDAFESKGLISRKTMSGFTPGCNKPSTRWLAVREMLISDMDKSPPFLLIEENCPETVREFGKYNKKRLIRDGSMQIMDEPENPRIFDCMMVVEYGLTHLKGLFQIGEAYMPPVLNRSAGSPAYQYAQRMLARQKSQNPNENYVNFGPSRGRVA